MIGFGDFFKKINNSFSKEIILRTTIKGVIKKHTNIEIPIEDISVKSNIVSFKKISQAARASIFIKKGVIIDELIRVNNLTNITDIR